MRSRGQPALLPQEPNQCQFRLIIRLISRLYQLFVLLYALFQNSKLRFGCRKLANRHIHNWGSVSKQTTYPYRIFPRFYRFFPQNLPFFSANTLMYLEFSKAFPIRGFEPRTEKYPILETFLSFFKLRRFGGVGAPEGRENVPARRTPIYTIFFRKILPYFSAKCGKQGSLPVTFWRT